MNYIICHYNEIGLKGKNRRFFEEKLIENIKKNISKNFFKKIKRISGRIIMELNDLTKIQKEEIRGGLEKVFGLAYFCFAQESKQELGEIEEQAKKLLKKEKFNSFRVSVQRSNKNFPLTSVETEKQIGAFVLEEFRKRVDLTNPEITLFIEIVENYVFLYTEKIQGLGGLPVGTAGRAICLLSDGIDSPVAAWQMMKRGLEIVFIHFYAYSENEKKAFEKVKNIVKILNFYQFQSKLYLVPFKAIQQEIFKKKENKYCCLVCKRIMFNMAEEIAKQEKSFTLITGDSLGQVASQTIENMNVIEKATNLLVLRPLISFDKQEIIKIAKKINTYDLSIIPTRFYCQDCLPKHPITRANSGVVEKVEKEIQINEVKKEILKQIIIEKFKLSA
ncbi:tRNA 4-thiouridine(8) synthase ThiI [Patescibacteria group bacterium]|nr:tRNA 4-thiouridine(8) synthase ThiI [Patescibacteria group bacterium]